MAAATISPSLYGRLCAVIKIGDKISERFRVTSRIATGGMADVYEAHDLIGKRVVSIKVMKEELLADPLNSKRFEQEAIAAASFNHPNIVKVYGQGEVDGRPYMVNEYINGQTLRDKLNFQISLPIFDACEIMLQLTDGIAYIHRHGLIHRDIKPDNLFYMNDGTLKISDFGISAPIGKKEVGDAVEGTVYYCAPEVLTGKPASIANDIYSMGVVFYEILVGAVPFDGVSAEEIAMKQITKRFPEPSKKAPSIPKSIDKIIIDACRKRPEERYQSAAEMHEAIVKAMEDKEHFKEKKGILSRIFGFK